MASNGKQWQSVAISGNQRQSVAIARLDLAVDVAPLDAVVGTNAESLVDVVAGEAGGVRDLEQ
eukprot:2717899-Prymnesium_polylepis.1